MNQKNCMVAQSGGPTVAINASLAGVIDGVSASSMYDTVYGSLNGITGILNDDLLNLTELMDGHPEYLSRLAQTTTLTNTLIQCASSLECALKMSFP